ncbi:MAG: cysteine-rich small domain-containing protein [Defluviitaleaceae bacterium]|nr:cysteine-rich small domain-containing protein [Defluviitaleaceae bacterium]
MENSYRFYRNTACRYFPCHEKPSEDEFNCMFCYCPLFLLGDKCGGLFEMNYGIKDCSNCHLPHTAPFYDVVVKKLSDIISKGADNYAENN